MKTLFTALALSLAFATPALSQTSDRMERFTQYQPRTYGYDAYALDREMRVVPRPGPLFNPRYDVYGPRGGYVGSDPDPRVRDQLRRDPTQGRE